MKTAASTPESSGAGTWLAKRLLAQAEGESFEASFHILSAIDKLTRENPKMTMACLRELMANEMPKAREAYLEYLRTT